MACAALHMAFSVWHAAAKPAPVANKGAACAVIDGSLAVTGTSSAATSSTSAAADTEPASTVSANGTGTAGGSSVAIGDTSPAASAVSEGGAAPTPRCCMHVLMSFWVPQKWQCSMCVCVWCWWVHACSTVHSVTLTTAQTAGQQVLSRLL